MIDSKGRCCGRKPIVYKGRLAPRGLFCWRCDALYDLDTKQQIANWGWTLTPDGWQKIKQTRLDDGPGIMASK